MIKIAIDAMGGDNAPDCVIEGCATALANNKDVCLVLFGQENLLKEKISSYNIDTSRIEIVDAPEIITMHDHPVFALTRTKKNSSLAKAAYYLKEDKAEALISAGSSGALTACGLFIIPIMEGIKRPAFAALIPTRTRKTLLIDSGANVDVKPDVLLTFAKIGTVYVRELLGIENPEVGILNIGAEKEKGNDLVKQAFPLLEAEKSINFIGSCEARDVPGGVCDVLVCDGFDGNIFVKTYEGTLKTIISLLKETLKSSVLGSIGGLLIKKPLKNIFTVYDASKYGGAPLLGCKKLIFKTHGNCTGSEISAAILQCANLINDNIISKLENALKEK